MNNSHQQSSKENMESKCKNTRKHTLVAREVSYCRNFPQNKCLKKKKIEMERRNKKRKRCAETYLLFTHLIGLNKEKKQSQRYFLLWGGNYPNVPPLLPTIKSSPIAL